MRIIGSLDELREATQTTRCQGRRIGLVPTMGALHEGHLSLVDAAREETDVVVMSVFVNPTQFGPSEDFERYPRDLARDRALAERRGVDILFTPDTATLYPDGTDRQTVWVEPGSLAVYLCGASRSGHFRAVATVVAKLFNLVQPDRAYFGQKDGQQAVIVSRMARELSFPVEVRVMPTVREQDGLALSSRNVYLSARERDQAVILWRALNLARGMIDRGERDAQAIERAMRDCIASDAPLGRLDYASVADLGTLQPISGHITGDVIVALAVYFGSTRLIDNMMVRLGASGPAFD
jgi:pantoate--beta-alanine ligase